MIQPHELIATVSILEYNSGQCDDENWNPIVICVSDIEDLIGNPKIFNDYYRPIPLTERILVEWCGAKNEHGPTQYRLGNRLIFIRDGKFVDYGSSVELPYLHIFQRFILALTNEPLKIELK